MVATAGGVLFGGRRRWPRSRAAVVWFVAFGLTRYASVASIVRRAARLPIWLVAFDYPTVGDRARLRRARRP